MKPKKIMFFVLLIILSSLVCLPAAAMSQSGSTITITHTVTRTCSCICSSGCFARLRNRLFSTTPVVSERNQAPSSSGQVGLQSVGGLRRRVSSNESKVLRSRSSPTRLVSPAESPVPPLNLGAVKFLRANTSHDELPGLPASVVPGQVEETV